MKIKKSQLEQLIQEVVDELQPKEKRALQEVLLREEFTKDEIQKYIDGEIKIAKAKVMFDHDKYGNTNKVALELLDSMLQIKRMISSLKH
jgi:vacuolar-type H+-ATPase catalytic subunit A/Vma1